MMSNQLILLTGGTGHVGYATLLEALRTGYKVRAVVRRTSSIAEMKATASIQPFLSNLSFVIIEDFLQPDAFDSAARDVDYIVHIASPIPRPSDDYESTFIGPAVKGTINVLNSAIKSPSIKRVVITSSVGACVPAEGWIPGYEPVMTADSHVPTPSPPYDNFMMAYAASKIAAFNATVDFVSEKKPAFNVINIMPTFVVGKNELATTLESIVAPTGSNALIFGPVLGMQNPDGLSSITVHVDDVAFVHIASLKPEITGNRNFGCNSNGIKGIQFDDALEIVQRRFPKEVAKGVFPLGGHQKSNNVKFDTSETERVFGFKFKGFEDQIVSVAEWYAEVAAKA